MLYNLLHLNASQKSFISIIHCHLANHEAKSPNSVNRVPEITTMQLKVFSIAFLICQFGSVISAPVAIPAPAPVDGDVLKARIDEPILSTRQVVGGGKYHGVIQSRDVVGGSKYHGVTQSSGGR